MIDSSTPDRIVEANPVPTTLVDDDELVDSAVLFSSIVARRDGMNGTQTKEPIETHLTSRPWRRRPAFVLAGVALATVLLVGGTSLILAGGSDPDVPRTPVSPSTTTTTVDTTTTTTIETATTSTTVATVPSAAPVTWSRAVVESAENASIASVAAANGYLIAVGERTTVASQDEYPSDAAVWLSTDGVTWESIEDPSFKGLNGEDTDGLGLYDRSQAMVSVAAGPLGVIAVGRDEASGAIWISPDGRSWTQIADDRLAAKPMPLQRVAAGGPGWVAVGDDGQGNGWVWLSDDGVEWTVITQDAFSFEQNDAFVTLYDVVAYGDQLVAAGEIGFPDSPDIRNAVWVSSDGSQWQLAASGNVPRESLSQDPNRDMLFGFADTPLLSLDAITWTLGSSPSPPPTARATFHDTWAIAAGRDFAASAWASSDGGESWTKTLPATPEFSDDTWTVDTAPFGDKIVVVGTRPGVLAKAAWGNAADSSAEIWIAAWDGP